MFHYCITCNFVPNPLARTFVTKKTQKEDTLLRNAC